MTHDSEEQVDTLSDLLSRAQARRGLTDHECAAELNVTQQKYSSWKRGTKPRSGAHEDIARFLRMKVNKLRPIISPPISIKAHKQIKLSAPGESILITRRGGGSILIEMDESGFKIQTNPPRI